MKEQIIERLEGIIEITTSIKKDIENDSFTYIFDRIERIQDSLRDLKDFEFDISLIERFEALNWLEGVTDFNIKLKLSNNYNSMALYLMQNYPRKIVETLCYPVVKILVVDENIQRIDCKKIYTTVNSFVKTYYKGLKDDECTISESTFNDFKKYLIEHI